MQVLDSPTKLRISKRRVSLDSLSARDLDGRTWTKWSISIWDIVKTPEERSLGHPAMFPVELCERLIRVYTRIGDVVLDPFMGSGSTLVAAKKLFRKGIGFELYDYFIELARKRLSETKATLTLYLNDGNELEAVLRELDLEPVLIKDDAINVDKYLDDGVVDMILTSPPYFNVHNRERTSDKKEKRPYGNDPRDLGNINDYNEFMRRLGNYFEKFYKVLRDGGIAAVVVMDIREGPNFYPFHIDLHNKLVSIGFKPRDIIIWDRRMEYNNIRPIGYPNKFIINKIHEYIMIYEK